MSIELTDEERHALLALIDIAVKAAGLNVAEAAVELAKKLRDKPEGSAGEALEA